MAEQLESMTFEDKAGSIAAAFRQRIDGSRHTPVVRTRKVAATNRKR